MSKAITGTDLTISIDDLNSWKAGEKTNLIHDLWQMFLEELPSRLRQEALQKGLSLTQHPAVEEDWAALYLKPEVKGATKKLKKKLERAIPYIICLKDA